ncbi:hypothetical protein ACVFYP_13550 [Roseomonas sp. F4]
MNVRKPGRWASIVYPPVSPRPRATYLYAYDGHWAAGHRMGFADIARIYGIADVWDLILYNFQLRNPSEVNWALNHFLGCTKSLDGINYCLDRHDRNPAIAIPPLGWHGLTPYDDRVRDRVLDTLADPVMAMIRFRMGPLKVTPQMFDKVASAVRSHSIMCIAMGSQAPENVRALYSQPFNFFWIRDPGSFDLGKCAVVVHESLHAGMDITKQAGNLLLHEAAAHTAEAMRIALVLDDPRTIDVDSMPSAHGRAAMRLAKRILTHNMSNTGDLTIPLGDAHYLVLREALRSIPTYGSRAGQDIGSNGI